MYDDRQFTDMFGAFVGGRGSMMGIINSMIDDMGEIYSKNNEKLAELKKEWWDAVKLPRKKKKAARKRIYSDYSTFLWCKTHMEEQGYHHLIKKEQ